MEKSQSKYAVIFTSERNNLDEEGYQTVSKRMMELASQEEGFMGADSARSEIGITVCYWKDKESIKQWKENMEHSTAREMGKSKWYQSYKVVICKVENEYEWSKIKH